MNNMRKRVLGILLTAAMLTPTFAQLSLGAAAGDGFITLTPTQTIEASGGTGGDTVTVEPYIMDFTSVGAMNRTKAEWARYNDVEEGKQQQIVNSGEDNSTRLIYSPGTGWAPYRGFLRFQEANVITSAHKWCRITYKAVDNTAAEITITNNAGAGTLVAVSNTKVSDGKWVVSDAFDISQCGLLDRLIVRNHVTVEYTSTNPEAEFYIKNIMFFGSEEQAYSYVGDESSSAVNYSVMTFGASGSATTNGGANYGEYTVNDADGTIDITCAESTNMKSNYMAKIKFNNGGSYNPDNYYTRVLYAAENPEGVDSVAMYLICDNNGQTSLIASDVKNTNGEFVLSETNCLAITTNDRFASGMHASLVTNNNKEGGEYRIKAIYFFPTREAADAFTVEPTSYSTVTINGNDISLYQIVIDTQSPSAVTAAYSLQKRIADVSGVTVPVVDQSTTVSKYEILIDKSSRALSTAKFDELQASSYNAGRAIALLEGDTLVVVSDIPAAASDLVSSLLRTHFYDGLKDIPASINIDETVFVDAVITPYNPYDWGEDINVTDPLTYNFSLDFDEGYFAEENGADDWHYHNGVYMTETDDLALSYVHVFEKDTELSAKLKFENAGSNADMGIMVRYNSAEAWIRAGYDFESGEWYIDSREGKDFYRNRIASVTGKVTEGKRYELKLIADETTATLYVDGKQMLTSNKATHTSPGRVGVYAEDITLSVDDAELVLLSGEGTVWTYVSHTKLPYDYYLEGGSVYEMNDGSLIYQNHKNVSYKSIDGGITWVEHVMVFPNAGYYNVIRLNNGDWLQIFSEGGSWKSRTSSDDGKTWTTGGIICATKYPNSDAGAGNMNDKLMQTASGRIFYGQNYEYREGTRPDHGNTVFCEFYYSDDNGKTWAKSETDSWEIEGNEKTTYFGEAKLLECADGTIRMYASWHTHGCIVYSESKDGGKTFGPLVKMEDFPTSRSSMQFVRDTYADNDYTYYMVWVNGEPISANNGMPRARLTMAKSTDGKNWTVLGDVWRWESGYMRGNSHINHIVDPFIKVTEDTVLVGSGFSEHTPYANENGVSGHNGQRQHIYSIPKTALEDGEYLGSFTDVSANDSYYEAVKFAVDEGLFNGTSETTFSPDAVMDRAMFVTVLGRLDKADISAYTTPTFNDVKPNQWYTSYVEWAAANGIVNGTGNGVYGVTGEVTVEQACTILYRYADGKTAAQASGMTVADFTDGDCVSAWAADAVKWAVENGIYTGVGESLSPTCAAPRWLVAAMFANYASLLA